MRVIKHGFIFIIFLLAGLRAFSQAEAPATVEPEPLEVRFSLNGGFFSGEVELQLFSTGTEIYYTTNGTKPNKRAIRYRQPIRIKETTVIRAVAYRGNERGITIGHTFFIEEPATTFPVVSISLPSWVLFDRNKGLFMQGKNVVDTIISLPGANFWSRKEVVVNTEIFESDGSCVFRSESGMRLFGGMSRLFPQKSLAIVARDRYGKKRIDHPLFGDKGPKKYKYIVLRNAGSDWGKAHFRDAFMTGLLDDWDLEKQAYRPCHVYINGDYWGIYNIREKVNRFFVEDHADVDRDSIDLLEHYMSVKRGSRRHYRQMLDYMKKNDLSDPGHFAHVEGMMEVDNFMDYQIAQIFFDNQDAGGNIKFWRPQTPEGRWRWILYDTDWGFGLHDDDAYLNNSLAFHTKPNGPRWPNPPWSTFILRNLLKNENFQKKFLNRFADRLNTTFDPVRIEQHIDRYYFNLLPEMPRHLHRWRLSENDWQDQVGMLRTFARERSAYVWMHLMERFDTGALRHVKISSSSGGTLLVNDNIRLRDQQMEGTYFEKVPLSLKAIPDYGYRFSHWEGIAVDDQLRELHLSLNDKAFEIRAVFEKYIHPLAGKIIINEVSPNNRKAGDWIEIFNYSRERVSLNGWILTDTRNEFIFPDVSIDANDYLVICQDSAKFMTEFPRAYNVIGGMDFGLNKRHEVLRLFANANATVDSTSYQIFPTDSTFTLNLLLPYLENSDPENWEQRWGAGSPNAPNAFYLESSIRQVQQQWMQVGLAAAVVLLCLLLLFLRHQGTF